MVSDQQQGDPKAELGKMGSKGQSAAVQLGYHIFRRRGEFVFSNGRMGGFMPDAMRI